MGGACGAYGGGERCAQGVGGKARGKEAIGGPVGARFSAPVQTGREAHPASYAMGTGSLSGVKRPGRGVGHPPHLAPRLTLYLRTTYKDVAQSAL
jgi:hypothetical protein